MFTPSPPTLTLLIMRCDTVLSSGKIDLEWSLYIISQVWVYRLASLEEANVALGRDQLKQHAIEQVRYVFNV